MNNSDRQIPPPDQRARERSLDAGRSALVTAPAGSGKTDLLTRRFLRLLAIAGDPGEIVAITFTKAAAAEMRQRILNELEKSASRADVGEEADPFSMETLARKAIERSQAAGWDLINLPAQLRIMTIDAFCRELALQQPLLSELGGGLEIAEQEKELYRRAARRTLNAIGAADADLREAIETLLLWRDNSWQDVESQLVEMLGGRDRWMREAIAAGEGNWEVLRLRLERPFERAVRGPLTQLSRMLDGADGARDEILELARFACEQCEGFRHQALAELAEFPVPPFESVEELQSARDAFQCLAAMLLTGSGTLRKTVDKTLGFPAHCKPEKARMLSLIAQLGALEGLEAALNLARELPPPRYTPEDWHIVQACFTVLKRAAAELKLVFAESGRADYTEVAQIAAKVLSGDEGIPGEGALAAADNVKHLLVDEFQDTSRKQHRLLQNLIAAWPDREGRTCFVVGDPMQSIYLFRDADAELFGRVERLGLEIEDDLPMEFDAVNLSANFRTAHELVATLNQTFAEVFRIDDGSGVAFAPAEAARNADKNHSAWSGTRKPRFELHMDFMPASRGGKGSSEEKERVKGERKSAQERQTAEIVELIRGHLKLIEDTRRSNQGKHPNEREKYRVAVLGRTRRALAVVAAGLRDAGVPFRAVDLEQLQARPEVMDALALGRALMNCEDRIAWLGVLRAPWCGLALDDLHRLAGVDPAPDDTADDDPALNNFAEPIRRPAPELMPVPELINTRVDLLSADGRMRVTRLLRALEAAPSLRHSHPATQLGTWLEQVWLRVGGAECLNAAERANLDLLWSTLDALPEGEQDFTVPALDSALQGLFATPDPGVDSDCGVQLMTIHGSKGLEFEVVIVPELQAGTWKGEQKMLTWMERGVLDPDEAEEPTELLVAPFQAKGAERSNAKAWVDRIYRERERQEMRRILYVAATRAREELHLFARPEYKEGAAGRELAEPRESLLQTAWPALKPEIERRFNEWNARRTEEVLELAAQAAEIIEMPGHVSVITERSKNGPRRLSSDWRPPEGQDERRASEIAIAGLGRLYERHEGGLESRALGRAVHRLLEHAAALRTTRTWDEVRSALEEFEPRITAGIRTAGIERNEAAKIARRAIGVAIEATKDEAGRWILELREHAETEMRWAAVSDGAVRTVQADRVFLAGEEPLSQRGDVWWIVDYKTAHDEVADLSRLRGFFAPQLEAYARVLRNLRGADAQICAGLYYPRMKKLDWWAL